MIREPRYTYIWSIRYPSTDMADLDESWAVVFVETGNNSHHDVASALVFYDDVRSIDWGFALFFAPCMLGIIRRLFVNFPGSSTKKKLMATQTATAASSLVESSISSIVSSILSCFRKKIMTVSVVSVSPRNKHNIVLLDRPVKISERMPLSITTYP